MEKRSFSALEMYMNKVFKLIILVIPLIALSAGTVISAIKIAGFYPDVPTTAIIIFDATCIIYVIIGFFFFKVCEDEEGVLIPGILKKGKRFLLVLCFVQWNFLSYMIPSRDYWAYSLFFIILAASFLDHKVVAICIAEILSSTIVSWIIIPDKLLPVRDEYFFAEMVLRCVLLTLAMTSLWLITYTVETRLTRELEKVADYDTLTLLFNRRKLGMHLDSARLRVKENDLPFSALMIDLDNFKSVNDTYGHTCGDEVLKNIANIIRTTIENNGVAFRYGGEEMLVLLYADEEEALGIAEALRKKIESHTTVYNNEFITITVTIGMAVFTPNDTNETLINRADANLYYGKNHGKNCVVK